MFGGAHGRLREIQFIPDADHTVRHGGETLAVFLPAGPSHEANVVLLDDSGIRLFPPEAPDPVLVGALTEAAVRQSAVDIEVDFADTSKPSLVALTVPAISHRK